MKMVPYDPLIAKAVHTAKALQMLTGLIQVSQTQDFTKKEISPQLSVLSSPFQMPVDKNITDNSFERANIFVKGLDKTWST